MNYSLKYAILWNGDNRHIIFHVARQDFSVAESLIKQCGSYNKITYFALIGALYTDITTGSYDLE